MLNVRKKSDCSGCHACVNICPKKCIVMKADEEGFLYPSVDLSKCVKCGLCKQVCHHHNGINNHNQPEAYACYSTDGAIRIQSSSGGVFTCLAMDILNRGGAVFGAAFDVDLTVKHVCVTETKGLEKLRGSKYLQSRIGDAYTSVKQMLKSGQLVLFTGTPCQIGGLKLFLGKDYDNLYTADVICHGAPSPKIWETYLEYIETQCDSRVDKCMAPSFRHKTPGKPGYSLCIHFEDGAEYCNPAWQDSYMGAFVNDLTLRPSCYRCEFKSLYRNSDITMADFWGADKIVPNIYDHNGMSLVFLNSEKGRQLFRSIQDSIVYQKVSLNEAVQYNPSAYKSAVRPFKRKKFIANVSRDNFKNLYQICVKKSMFELICHKGKRLVDLLSGKVKR